MFQGDLESPGTSWKGPRTSVDTESKVPGSPGTETQETKPPEEAREGQRG